MNLVPTSTGAAKADRPRAPELDGKLNGIAVRAPGDHRLGGRPGLRGLARDDQGGDQRGLRREGRLRGARGHPQVQRGPDRVHRHRQVALLVDLRRPAHDGDRRQAREGRGLVRQRVGLLEPRGRPGPARPRWGAGCLAARSSASAPSATWSWRRASACSSAWTSTCRSTAAGSPTTPHPRGAAHHRAAARAGARASSCARTSAGPRAATRDLARARVGAARRADRRAGAPGAGGDRPGGAARGRPARPRRRAGAREHALGARRDRERPRARGGAGRRSPTPTSTTRSARRTARMRRPSGWPSTCARRWPACCSSAR